MLVTGPVSPFAEPLRDRIHGSEAAFRGSSKKAIYIIFLLQNEWKKRYNLPIELAVTENVVSEG